MDEENLKNEVKKLILEIKKGRPLWDLGIKELEGHIIESRGREDVNELLKKGWILLHIYTLKYQEEDGTWRERPMAILGRPQNIF